MPEKTVKPEITLLIDNSAATGLLRTALAASKELYVEAEMLRENEAKRSGNEYTPLTKPEFSCKSLNQNLTIKVGFWLDTGRHSFNYFDDRMIDILDFITHLIHKRAKAVDDCVVIYIDEVCDTLGYQKIMAGNGYRGGHRQKNRSRILRDIDLLESIWICTQQTRTRNGKQERIAIQQRLFAIFERGCRDLGSKEKFCWVAIKVGDFFTRLVSSRPHIARIPLALLAYDPQKYWWEKRLGKYLYRFPSRRHRIRSIVSICRFLKKGDRLYRFRARFDSALQKLKNDGLINSYKYVADQNEIDCDMRSPNWFERWMDSYIEVELHCRSP